MKKILVVLLVVFIANLGCKKLDEGDRLCACSPISEPPLTLIIKGANGVDLLNPATNGYFASGEVKLYYQNGGTEKQIAFNVGKPFSYGNAVNEKFEYYQIQSSELIRLAALANQTDIYLKLGNGTPLLLKATMDSNVKYKVAKLMVGNIEATAETGPLKNILPNIFYITLP